MQTRHLPPAAIFVLAISLAAHAQHSGGGAHAGGGFHGGGGYGHSFSGNRSGYGYRDNYRYDHRFLYNPWIGYAGYPDWSYYDDSVPPPADEAPQPALLAEEPAQPVPAPYVAAAPAPAYRPTEPAAPLDEEDPVTIVFKDGRPNEHIQNYALTRTDLIITGKRVRDIPLDQIDLAATEKANADAGVDFSLPHAQ